MPTEPIKTMRLHPAVQAVIENYVKLRLGGKEVVAPYFMNTLGRKGRRVSVGKGMATQLERETIRLAKKHKFDLDAASSDKIRNFMISHKLGIDCSGLVAWLTHELIRQQYQGSLWRHIHYKGHPVHAAIVRRIRPVENLSARLLTDGEDGVNWIFNAANNFPDDTRVVRLKALAT